LDSVPEIELDLESQALKVKQLVVSQFQITAEQDRIRPGLGRQINSEQDEDFAERRGRAGS
jgi:hypothetical protein